MSFKIDHKNDIIHHKSIIVFSKFDTLHKFIFNNLKINIIGYYHTTKSWLTYNFFKENSRNKNCINCFVSMMYDSDRSECTINLSTLYINCTLIVACNKEENITLPKYITAMWLVDNLPGGIINCNIPNKKKKGYFNLKNIYLQKSKYIYDSTNESPYEKELRKMYYTTELIDTKKSKYT